MTVVVVGAGNLAHALVRGWHAPDRTGGTDRVVRVLARSASYREKGWDPDLESLITREAAVVETAEVLVLAVKPKDIEETSLALAERVARGVPVISVAAGIPLARLETWWPGHPLARVMPNVCIAVGEGTTAAAYGGTGPEEARQWTRRLFAPLGYLAEVPEEQLDAVTALSGSGPAYLYLVIDALVRAGTALGLPADLARELAARTVRGAGSMALAYPDRPPARLIAEVASPGGTTEAALRVLEAQEVPDRLVEAIRSAGAKAQALGRVSAPAR
ncbi:Pyrroline-5-carboxylate reductase [Candidatus Hydrogenisulfobacillus filiaventi]|uniref:Pyrroline-5-carboxylate reductase n=1 Tax=Candidatus Hydrogenisulfobacillus filiaventi TaxID=2707344 RepID=A0A6F8ZEZ4_9FIRM|nr:pyrroline-5-carboxylate reductase [Bacillota bacterium]CAB1128240.1 Pyrroline-5-carboxylate reductase [Candidatus Hydrogenisulfobacillus filiaventi]